LNAKQYYTEEVGNMRRSKGLGRIKTGEIINALVLFLISLITLYPFWHVVMYSLSNSQASLSGGLFLWPRQLDTLAYRLLFNTTQIYVSYKNTIIRAFGGTFISITLSALTAYPLSRKRFHGRGIISMFIFFTMLFSGGMIPTYLVVQKLGLLNSLWALILPTAMSAYNMFILRNFFQSIPASLEESAMLDGATPIRILWSVMLPLSLPALAAVSMFYGVAHWNSYIDAVLYIDDTSKQVLQVYLRQLLSSFGSLLATTNEAMSNNVSFSDVSRMTDETMKMATITASVIPVLIAYPWLQKYYVKGVMIGSVKG
jgi:putative aldouronate transport system permease protein